MFAPLKKLDAFVQKRFDAACFFLMRRFGVRKSTMRYVLTALIILSIAASFVFENMWGQRSVAGAFITIPFILLMLAGQRWDRKNDEAAEARPGTASQADSELHPLLTDIIKVFCVGELALTLALFSYVQPAQAELHWTVGQVKILHVFDLVWWVAMLFLMYLRRTPLNPPPEKVTESIFTPAPAES